MRHGTSQTHAANAAWNVPNATHHVSRFRKEKSSIRHEQRKKKQLLSSSFLYFYKFIRTFHFEISMVDTAVDAEVDPPGEDVKSDRSASILTSSFAQHYQMMQSAGMTNRDRPVPMHIGRQPCILRRVQKQRTSVLHHFNSNRSIRKHGWIFFLGLSLLLPFVRSSLDIGISDLQN